MEEAYSWYILQKAFPSSFHLLETSPPQIHIPGQDAVALLTKSGIHRLILRNIWTVSDPHNEGTLVHMDQLYTILRLVALAQAGMVEHELIKIGTAPPPKPTPTMVLKAILVSTQGKIIPLPHFDTIPVPGQAELQQLYQQKMAGGGGGTLTTLLSPAMDLSSTPGSSMARAKSVSPTPNWQQQQPSTANNTTMMRPQSVSPVPTWQEAAAAPAPPVALEGMAAFDALVADIPDQPLPSLTAPPSSADQKGLSETTPPPLASPPSIPPNPSFPTTESTSTSNVTPAAATGIAALDAFGQVANAPLPSLGAVPSSNNNIGTNDDEDDFGGFSAAPSQPEHQQQQPDAFSGGFGSSGGIDDFGGISATAQTQQQQQSDAFGDFSSPQQQQPKNVLGGFTPPTQQQPQQPTQPNNEVVGMDAFDALVGGGISNAPLPSLTTASTSPQPGVSVAATTASEEMEFGDFSNAPSLSQQQEGPTGMAALDAFGEVANAPLPSLSSKFGEPQQEQGQQQQQQAPPAEPMEGGTAAAPAVIPDDNEFGDFSNVPPSSQQETPSGIAALDAFGEVANAPLPSLSSGFGGPQKEQEQQGTSGGVTSDASPQKGGKAAAATAPLDDDEFGDFSNVPPSSQQEAPSGIAALDAFGEVTNAPLPSLTGGFGEPQQSTNGGFTSDAAHQQVGTAATTTAIPDDNEFGDFSDAPPSSQQEAPSGIAALDAFGEVSNAPLPSLAGGFGETQKEPEHQVGTDGFSSDAQPPQQQAPPSEPVGMDAFADAFGGIEDTPLPALGPPQSERVLGSTPSAPPPAIQSSWSFPRTGNENTGSSSTNNNSGDAGLSGWQTGSDARQQQRPNPSGMAAFDAFGDQKQDAPLPSLASAPQQPKSETSSFYSAFSEDTKSDDLGDFVDAKVDGGGENAATSGIPEDSFGSFTAAEIEEAPQRQHSSRSLSLQGSSRSLARKKSENTVPPETPPKDLMPHLPGQHYARKGSMKKLPEFHDEDLAEDDNNNDNEKKGSRDEDDPFAELEPARHGRHVHRDSLNNPIDLSETLPRDLTPHAPGEHYVPHSPDAAATPGGLETLADGDENDDGDGWGDFEDAPATTTNSPVVHPATAKHADPFTTKMPHELTPHAPGQHYVPHNSHASKTPGGLDTVGEKPAAQSQWNPDLSQLNPPTVLARQETPLPQDLKPHAPGQHYVPHSPKDSKTPGGLATVGEALGEMAQSGDFPLPSLGEDDKVEGDSDQLGGLLDLSLAPPTQLNRQATPAVHELQPMTRQAQVPGFQTIYEDEEGNDFGEVAASSQDDGFGSFASVGTPAVPSPTQLSRQATPSPQELSAAKQEKPSGGTLGGNAIQEGDEDDNSSSASNDPFSAFDSLAAPQPSLPPLSSFGPAAEQPSDMAAPTQLSRQPTPAVKDLEPLTKKSANVFAASTITEGGDNDDDNVNEDRPVSSDNLAPTDDDPFCGFERVSASTPLPALEQKESMDFSSLAAGTLSRQTSGASTASQLGVRSKANLLDEEEDDDGFAAFMDVTPKHSPKSEKRIISMIPIPIAESEEAEEEDEDDFGDFAGPSVTSEPTQLARQATPSVQDLQPTTRKTQVPETATIHEEEESEDFFDAGIPSMPAAMPGQMEIAPPTQMKRQATPRPQDLRPDFKGEKAEAPGLGSIGEDLAEMAPDGSITSDASPPPQLSRTATPAAQDLQPMTGKTKTAMTSATPILEERDEEGEDDFFGGFESAGGNVGPGAVGEGAGIAIAEGEEEDEFGGFAAAAAAPSHDSVDFGDFSGFSSEPPPVTEAPSDDFGDFASFESAQASAVLNDDIVQLRSEIVSLSEKLPQAFRASVDFGKLFDVIIAGQVQLTEQHKKRARRCVQVLSLLSSSHTKLASTLWMQVMTVALDELSLGCRLLEEASGLTSQERQMAQQPLEVMVAGMGEYIRATRSIVASVGDMLLLDVSTPFTDVTFDSAWGHIPLLKLALNVEKLWKEILDKSAMLGIAYRNHSNLETLVEIRTKCLGRCPSSTLCHLSLQPLSDGDKETTKAMVEWGGKKFMACSANLLANKCPFYVVDE
jgi:hypothetical protein